MMLLICGILKEQRYKRTYLQNRNRPTDIKKKLRVIGEKGGEGKDKLRDWDCHIHTAAAAAAKSL